MEVLTARSVPPAPLRRLAQAREVQTLSAQIGWIRTSASQIDRLWRRGDVAIREKALWRLLYETAARASEVLSLNVEDLDVENRRSVVRSKGGDVELLHFQTGSARLLPRLIAGRSRGPLF
jgi:integrase